MGKPLRPDVGTRVIVKNPVLADNEFIGLEGRVIGYTSRGYARIRPEGWPGHPDLPHSDVLVNVGSLEVLAR
jgi:hypothetical protein